MSPSRANPCTRVRPFEYVDMSVKQPYGSGWKDKVRTRIRRCHGVIVLVSMNSLPSSEQQ